MTRSLVIGGSGYVGRELVRQLGARPGDEVHLLGRSQPAPELPATWLPADITQRESCASPSPARNTTSSITSPRCRATPAIRCRWSRSTCWG